MAEVTAYCDPHPDVMWFDEAMEITPRVLAKRRKLIEAEDPDTGMGPVPNDSKALPGTRIDRSFGVCVCWLCRPREMPKAEAGWMFDVLAKDALRRTDIDLRIWLQDWTLRHGKFAGEVLKLHMWQQQRRSRTGTISNFV